MKSKNLEELIKKGDKKEIVDYLHKNGIRKNVSPISFIEKEEKKNE